MVPGKPGRQIRCFVLDDRHDSNLHGNPVHSLSYGASRRLAG
jgi:hypothetical protein